MEKYFFFSKKKKKKKKKKKNRTASWMKKILLFKTVMDQLYEMFLLMFLETFKFFQFTTNKSRVSLSHLLDDVKKHFWKEQIWGGQSRRFTQVYHRSMMKLNNATTM